MNEWKVRKRIFYTKRNQLIVLNKGFKGIYFLSYKVERKWPMNKAFYFRISHLSLSKRGISKASSPSLRASRFIIRIDLEDFFSLVVRVNTRFPHYFRHIGMLLDDSTTYQLVYFIQIHSELAQSGCASRQ